MDLQSFFDYLRRNQGRAYLSAKGKRFTYEAHDQPAGGCSLEFNVEGMSPTSSRSMSAARIADFLAIFNANPFTPLDEYRNQSGKRSPAYNAQFLVALMQDARRSASSPPS